jgi:nucleotide-binding universal stress UspA family protein
MKVKPARRKGAVTLELSRRDEPLLEQAAPPRLEPLAIRKILVPIDFSEFSHKSLDYAAAFALQSGAEIVLLHVVPLNYVDAEVIAFDFSKLEKQAAASCEARLQRLREQRVDPALQCTVKVVTGRPVEEIVAAARSFGADMIVMSTHGYTGLKHAFLGSTTENVVRYAPCPVLTLRQHEHDFVTSSPAKDSSV